MKESDGGFNELPQDFNVSCIEEAVVLRRRCGYYLINVYIPTVLIVIMSMLTFWIPYDAVPARITLGVTSLLTIITKQYQASMPNVSYIVALNVWLSCCIAFVFFSLLEFAAVIAMSTKSKRKPKSVFRDSPDLILPMYSILFICATKVRLSKQQDEDHKRYAAQRYPTHVQSVTYPANTQAKEEAVPAANQDRI
ncbi:glycine receptor subunit alpha-1 [Trichonephila clavipes]|nr:glycine receptor subunit alpha-1 [Trichonephila clavipes]